MKQLTPLLALFAILAGCSSYSPEFQERQALIAAQDHTIYTISSEMSSFRTNSTNSSSFWTPDQWAAWNRLLDQYNLAVQHKQDLIDQYMAHPTSTTQTAQTGGPTK